MNGGIIHNGERGYTISPVIPSELTDKGVQFYISIIDSIINEKLYIDSDILEQTLAKEPPEQLPYVKKYKAQRLLKAIGDEITRRVAVGRWNIE